MLLNTRSLAIHVPVCVNSAEGMVVEFLSCEDAQCFILVSLSQRHERWCLGCIFVAATLRLRECCSLRSIPSDSHIGSHGAFLSLESFQQRDPTDLGNGSLAFRSGAHG